LLAEKASLYEIDKRPKARKRRSTSEVLVPMKKLVSDKKHGTIERLIRSIELATVAKANDKR
jgi:hypothetical protein|tara:strand:+ start:562 stop:747 length:186 start_codon:yes stop_codon:yes gene_type:complete